MPTIRHLVDRGGSYHARLSVPPALRPIVGKTELWAALRATDRRDANRKLPAALARLHAVIEAARAEAKAAHILMQAPRPGQLLAPRQVALAHYSRELERDNRGRNFPGYDTVLALREISAPAYTDCLRRVASGAAHDDEANAVIGWAIDVFALNGNVKAEYGSTEWRALARQLAAIQLEIEKQKDARDRGESGSSPTHALLTNQPEPAAAKDAARMIGPDSSKPLNEIALDYVKERHAAPQTEYEARLTAKLFEECLGDAKSVYRITRQDVHAFKRMLADLPTNATKRFPGMTAPQAIAANKLRATPYPALDPRTINDKYLSKLAAIFNWCVRNDVLPDNPASGIKVDAVTDKKSGTRFSPGDLAKIFSPERYDTREAFDEQQWAELMALFSGARAGELAQIRLDSIRHERGILVMRIEEKTKTGSSQRVVPIHSTLIALGLQKRVDQLRANGETHLFPEWYGKATASHTRREANGKSTSNDAFPRFVARTFNVTILPKLGINDRRKHFHTFRHTFKSTLKDAGVEKAMRDDLCGHADNSAGAVYLHGDSIEAKKAAIEKLHFDGFHAGAVTP